MSLLSESRQNIPPPPYRGPLKISSEEASDNSNVEKYRPLRRGKGSNCLSTPHLASVAVLNHTLHGAPEKLEKKQQEPIGFATAVLQTHLQDEPQECVPIIRTD